MKHEKSHGKFDLDGNRCGLTCGGGGGGGGDGGAAAREQQRQARIDAATQQINAIFGMGAPTESVQVGTKAGTKLVREKVSGGSSGRGKSTPKYTTKKVAVQIPIYEQKVSAASKAAEAREGMYDEVRADTNEYYSDQLAETSEEAARQLRFQQARQGTMGSSQQIDQGQKFQQQYDRGLLDIANRADSAASQIKSNDEQTRLSLLSKVAAGMDQASAMSSAHAQLASNAEIGRQNATSGQMANVFSDLFAANNAAAAADGQRKAQQEFDQKYGAFFPTNGNYSGTVQNK